MPLQGRRLEGRRRPVTTTCEWGFRCCRPHGQGGHLWLPRRLPLRDDVDRAIEDSRAQTERLEKLRKRGYDALEAVEGGGFGPGDEQD